MSKENLCWTCSKCMTTKCPKHENPIIEKEMWRTKVYECDRYDYDGDVSLVVSTCSSENELFFSARNEEAYKDFIDDISKDIYEILKRIVSGDSSLVSRYT